jgi:hypothetical protein
MRAASTAFGLLLVVGCGKREPPPSLPQAEAHSAEPEEVAAPTKPTPAFVPSEQGSCSRGYHLVDSTCVHVHYRAGDESTLRAALGDYQRGAAPPMLGVGPAARAPEPPKANKPDPGSLMRKSAGGDAGSAKDQRLAELDAMLAAARGLLAKRDEESKAKRVENAPRSTRGDAGTRAIDRDALDRFAQSAGGGGGAGPASAGPGNSESERMNELSRVTSQLSGDQLKALTDELGKSGFNASALESILNDAKDGQPQPMH